jgi:hypothetical protein
VLGWTYRPHDTARAFYRRRFARVVSAYAAAYTLFRLVEHPLEIRIREGGTAMPVTETRAAS